MDVQKIIEAVGSKNLGELIILTDQKEIETRNVKLFIELMLENGISGIKEDDSRGYPRVFFDIDEWKIMTPER